MNIAIVVVDDSTSQETALCVKSLKESRFDRIYAFTKSRFEAPKIVDSSVSFIRSVKDVEYGERDLIVIMGCVSVPSDFLKVFSRAKDKYYGTMSALCLSGWKILSIGNDGRFLATSKAVKYNRMPGSERYESNDTGDAPVHFMNNLLVGMDGISFSSLASTDRNGSLDDSMNDCFRMSMLMNNDGVNRIGLVCVDVPDSWGRPLKSKYSNTMYVRFPGAKWSFLMNCRWGASKAPGRSDPSNGPATEKRAAAARGGRVVVGLATYPPREDGMLRVVKSLSPQCDAMFVALNGYEGEALSSVLKKLERYENVTARPYTGKYDLGCQNKFRFVTECGENDYYLTADDDIAYPEDYVEKMVKGIDLFGGKAYVSFHGSRFMLDYGMIVPGSKKKVYVYGRNVPHTVRVNMAGTGVGGCIPSRLGVDFSIFDKRKNTGDDELLAIWARDNNVPMYVIRHGPEWLSTYDAIEKNGALWRNGQSMSDRMAMLRSSGPWTDYDAEAAFFRVVIPVHGSVLTLKRALASIEMQTSDNYVVSVCDDHSSEPEALENERSVKALGERGIFSRLVGSRYAGAARNEAMRHASNAKYTLFLDADDEFTFPTMFEELEAFIESHGYPDVVVLPFYHHSGRSTVSELAFMNSPAALASSRYQAPWTKCIKTSIVPKFQENMRRSNDVMQHFVTADTAKTVVAFNKACVRYNRDGETTMFGDRGSVNGKSADAIGCLLKSAADILMATWKNSYMKGPVARCATHIIKKMVPESMGLIGPSLERLVKSEGA